MTPREMLIKARPLIERKKREFICHALLEVNGQSVNTALHLNPATLRIMDLLKSCGSLNSWLFNFANVPLHQAGNTKLMREYRLRWIDHLLEHDPVFKKGKA